MLRKLSLAAAALAMGAGTLVPIAPAAAQGYYGDRYDRYDRYDRRGDYDRYDGYRDDRYARSYYGRDGSYRGRQRCNDGTGGTIIGAIAGGLLGNVVAGRGDRTLGTVLGAGGGALAGRAIDRSDRPGYCRR